VVCLRLRLSGYGWCLTVLGRYSSSTSFDWGSSARKNTNIRQHIDHQTMFEKVPNVRNRFELVGCCSLSGVITLLITGVWAHLAP